MHLRRLTFVLLPAVAIACGSADDAPATAAPPAHSAHAVAPTKAPPKQGPAGPSDAGVVRDPGSLVDAGIATPSAGLVDASVDSSPPPFQAAHAPFPGVELIGDGPVLTAPKIVTVTFASHNTQLRTYLEQFGDTITNTHWWTEVSRGYCAPAGSANCVGPGAGGGHVILPEKAKAIYTDDALQTSPSTLRKFIQDRVTSGAFPAPTPQTIYMIYFPPGVGIDLGGIKSCETFGAYHYFLDVTPKGGGASVRTAYGVMPDCGEGPNITIAASHELIEAATDPQPNEHTAYYMLDPAWLAVWGGAGEVGDLCNNPPPTGTYTESGFAVQRSWSNFNAQSGHSPCAPSPAGETFFNAAPEKQITELRVGESKTLEVIAYSDGPTGGWTLSAEDLLQDHLAFELDTTAAQNGTKAHIKVTLLKAPPNDDSIGGEFAPFIVRSTMGTKTHGWPASVKLKH